MPGTEERREKWFIWESWKLECDDNGTTLWIYQKYWLVHFKKARYMDVDCISVKLSKPSATYAHTEEYI